MSCPELEEDSPDLSDTEIEGAILAPEAGSVVKFLKETVCVEEGCSAAITPTSHALKRRKPSMFWKVDLRCASGHNRALVFRVPWLPATYGE
jgi:hypothetical protein